MSFLCLFPLRVWFALLENCFRTEYQSKVNIVEAICSKVLSSHTQKWATITDQFLTRCNVFFFFCSFIQYGFITNALTALTSITYVPKTYYQQFSTTVRVSNLCYCEGGGGTVKRSQLSTLNVIIQVCIKKQEATKLRLTLVTW